MNTKPQNLIRHPQQIPISIQAVEPDAINNVVYLGELAVYCKSNFPIAAKVMLHIRISDTVAKLAGKIIWSYKSKHGYLLGISFQSESEAYRMRMIEQLCYIEAYRKKLRAKEGRYLNREEAAAEWIARYSKDFPEISDVSISKR